MALLFQSTAYTRTFLMVLSSDHVSPATGKTVTVNISKAGGAFAAATNTPATEIANGWYKIAFTTTETNTLGDFSINCTASASDNTDIADQVVAFNPGDSVRLGLTALPNAAAGASGGLGTVDSTNSIKIQTPVKRNTALNNFTFLMLNTSGNPQTGLTVTGQVSIDGAAFVNLTNTPATEIANGLYKINLAAGDVNGTNILLRFTAASARDTDILLLTLP